MKPPPSCPATPAAESREQGTGPLSGGQFEISIADPLPGQTGLSDAVASAQVDPSREDGAVAAAAPASDPLFSLQQGRPGAPPIFCVPGSRAGVAGFADLIGQLGPDCPWYGFQPCGMDGSRPPHATVEAMAGCCFLALQARHPQGLVHLLGHSFGGWVALELALRLGMAGQPVASLTLVDAQAPPPRAATLTDAQILQEWLDVIELTLEGALGITVAELMAQRPGDRFVPPQGRMAASGLVPGNAPPEVLRGPVRTFVAALRAAYQHSGRFPGTLHLVLTDDPGRSPEENRQDRDRTIQGWRPWAGRIEVLHAPGNPMTLLRPPHVKVLAAWLQDVLRGFPGNPDEEAQAQGSDPAHAE